MATLLRMSGLQKRFGHTPALRGVSLELCGGEVLALIGENGSGKSTLLKVLSGAHAADEGHMELAGAALAPKNPHEARAAGVAMIYQELNLAPHLSVEDNILLGQELHRGGFLRRGAQRRKAAEVLARLGHPDLHPEAAVGELSIGAQQLVEIARALVVEAKVIAFDEPTSSLTARDVQRLFRVIRDLRDRGLGVIYVSHFLEEVREICDRCTVLRDGQVAGERRLQDVEDAEIVSLMAGRGVQELFPVVPHQPGEVILSLNGLKSERLGAGATFDLRRGEVLGIAGLVGAGRTELLRAVYGLDAVRGGSIRVAGNAPPTGPRGRIQAGMGFVSEDRKGEGLAQTRSIEDNATYSRLTPYARGGWLSLRRRRRVVSEWMRTLRIRARSPADDVQRLSGGNQQKVALARVLHQQADVLLLDEPTRGIDVGTKAEIYRLIGEQAASGKAVIFVSSYLPELLAVCDRLGVMARGKLRDIRPVNEWTEEQVLHVAIG